MKSDPRCITIDGDKLKGKRKEKGLTQDQLAEKGGISVETLRKKERPGPQNMFKHSVVALANALDCETCDLSYDQEIVEDEAEVADILQLKDDSVKEPLCDEPLLELSQYADEPLRMATRGLLKASGSKDRVSYAIAAISGYMRSIVWRAPELKFHMKGLVSAIVKSYDSAGLDDETSTAELRANLQDNLAALRKNEALPEHAKKETELIVRLLARSAETGCKEKLLRAVKTSMYWLRDYWDIICQDQAAHYAWSDVCCMLTGAQDDYSMRASIVREINEFALYVSLLDPLYEMMHK